MDKLTQEQFYNIMAIIRQQLSDHRQYLYHEYGYSSRLEGKIEELEYHIKNQLIKQINLDD